ncbi:MAG: DNA recombination protein RmuC, partial [Sphingobacteriales bacterium]|nr:DNA recombination protein RmuC [Sphingobacteriales bacterium]
MTIIIWVIAFIVGAIIAWFIAINKSGSTIAEQQTRLAAAEQKAVLLDSAQKELGQILQDKASLANEVKFLSNSVAEYKQNVKDKEKELNEKQTELSDALQARASAETTLIEARKAIVELQGREANLNNELAELGKQSTIIKQENAGFEATLKATKIRLEEQQQFVEAAQKNLKDAFGALSADALQHNNTSFVELAKARLEEKVTEAKGEFEKKEQAIGALVKPLSDSLKNMDVKIQDLEGQRIKAYSDIWNYLDQVKTTTEGLKKETSNLVGALKTSHTRGRYGELALRRLVEHAGMFEHCDFEEQVSVEDESGKLRPDMIIKLPGNKKLVVDSKA